MTSRRAIFRVDSDAGHQLGADSVRQAICAAEKGIRVKTGAVQHRS